MNLQRFLDQQSVWQNVWHTRLAISVHDWFSLSSQSQPRPSITRASLRSCSVSLNPFTVLASSFEPAAQFLFMAALTAHDYDAVDGVSYSCPKTVNP
jgi:hypothetical protein